MTVNKYLVFILVFIFIPSTKSLGELESFCDNLPRPAYSQFKKHEASNDWFEVYQFEHNVWAIYEPFQWQEVISYLIIGNSSALLVDSGNGIGDIKAVVDRLTDKPVRIINTHSHFDHIGGNYQFETILSPSTEFSISNSKGNNSQTIKTEVSTEALCKSLPKGVTQKSHAIKPYSITAKVKDGDMIDLGGRKIEILYIPGHTDDSIALFEAESGYLWTGDSFYEGPIWLWFPETDVHAYQQSISRLAALTPQLKALFPAHNIPYSNPSLLAETDEAFQLVLAGKAKSRPYATFEGTVIYDFDRFGFLMLKENKQ